MREKKKNKVQYDLKFYTFFKRHAYIGLGRILKIVTAIRIGDGTSLYRILNLQLLLIFK